MKIVQFRFAYSYFSSNNSCKRFSQFLYIPRMSPAPSFIIIIEEMDGW
jgi:hypothetical protein